MNRHTKKRGVRTIAVSTFWALVCLVTKTATQSPRRYDILIPSALPFPNEETARIQYTAQHPHGNEKHWIR